MVELILKCRKVSKGKARGKALVTREAICFMDGVDPQTGILQERGHSLEGACIKDRILVFPTGKGSSLGSFVLYEMTRNRTRPAGIITLRADPVIAAGAVIAGIPMVHRPEGDVFQMIQTGYEVELDADAGLIKVRGQPKDD